MKSTRTTAIQILAVCLFVSPANLANASAPSPVVQAVHSSGVPIETADVGNSHGGGGFTEIDEPVYTDQIVEVIKNSRLDITAWFHSLRTDYEDYLMTFLPSFDAVYYPRRAHATDDVDPAKTYARFFPDVDADIFAVMDQMQIEIADKAPCRDTAGNPVDGSFNPDRPLSICISAFTLAQKLKVSDYKGQTESLIVHEITHMRGGNEPEAVYVQTFALMDFTTAVLNPIDGSYQDYKSKIIPELIDISTWVVQSTSVSETNHLMQAFAIEMRALRDSLQADSFSLLVLDRKLFDRVYQAAKLASILANYTCSQDSALTAEKRASCQGAYDSGFGGDDSIVLSRYVDSKRADGYEYIADTTLRKTKSHDDFVAQMKRFQPLLQRVGDSVDSLSQISFRTVSAP